MKVLWSFLLSILFGLIGSCLWQNPPLPSYTTSYTPPPRTVSTPPLLSEKDIRIIPVIIVADEPYRRSSLWKKHARTLLEGASRTYAPFGLSFRAVSFYEWDAPSGHVRVPDLLADVRNDFPAPKGHLVLGLTGREFLFSATIDHIGMAYFFGSHALLRSMKTPDDFARFRARYPYLSREKREKAYQADVARRSQLVLEHEIGHIFGAIHVTDLSSVMYPSLTSSASGFDSFNQSILLANAKRKLGTDFPLQGDALSRTISLYQNGCKNCIMEEAIKAVDALEEINNALEPIEVSCPSPGAKPSTPLEELSLEVALFYAKCRYAAKDIEGAQQDIEAILLKNPLQKEANLFLASIFIELGSLEKAATLLERFRLYGDAELLAALGEVYVRLGNFKTAEAVLVQSLALKPSSVLPRLILSIVYIQQRKYQSAVDLLAPWVEEEEFPYDARYYLGLCYLGLGKKEMARTELSLYLKKARIDQTRFSDKNHLERQEKASGFLQKFQKKKRAR